jgi:hypothetical protein
MALCRGALEPAAYSSNGDGRTSRRRLEKQDPPDGSGKGSASTPGEVSGMKVRCRKCHKVSKVRDYTVAVCKTCGETLDVTQMPAKGLATSTPPLGPPAPGAKGRLVVRNWKAEIGRVALAFLALVVIAFGTIFGTEAVHGPPGIMVAGVFVAVAVMAWLAVWLERRAHDYPTGAAEPPAELTSVPVSFQGNARVPLASRERFSLWDAGLTALASAPEGSAAFGPGLLYLSGRWSPPMMASAFQHGLLGLLILRLIRRPRVEHVAVDNIELLIIHRKRKTLTFHLLQARDEGLAEVHVFQAGRKQDPEYLARLLQPLVPPERVVFEGDAAPA